MHLAPTISSGGSLRGLFLFLFVAAFAMALSVPARAQTWSEVGDAGNLPGSAQSTAGAGALTQINGSLPYDADVDMYCIKVTDLAAFTAHLNCAAINEPDIFLFNSAGRGVSLNQLCSGAMKRISNAFLTGIGTYYVAVGSHGALAFSGLNYIWLPGTTGERAPDGPGAAGAVTSWGGNPVAIPPYTYSIILTGSGPCNFITRSSADTWGGLRGLYR